MNGLPLTLCPTTQEFMWRDPDPYTLLIEDADDVRAVIQFSLESIAGWRFTSVRSNQDWMTIAQQTMPDVILVDADQRGTEILTELKRTVLLQDIPVIYFVARDRLTDLLQARHNGAAAIVSKPFDPLILIETVLGVATSS